MVADHQGTWDQSAQRRRDGLHTLVIELRETKIDTRLLQ
jgi:hypothetical protein